MKPHELRKAVCRLAPQDWSAAADLARRISDPWYACQAFAWCGRFAPPDASPSLLDEAFYQAESGKDGYQRVAAAAWPLRALIERGEHSQAEREFDRLAGIAPQVTPPSSGAEASSLLFQAAAVGCRELPTRAYWLVLSTCQPIQHWRQQRALRNAAIMAASVGMLSPDDAIAPIADPCLRGQVSARLSRGETLRPRSFFDR